MTRIRVMRADGEQECRYCAGLSGNHVLCWEFLGPGDQTSLVEIYGRSRQSGPEVLLARVLVAGPDARAVLRRVTVEEANRYRHAQQRRLGECP